jgi:hypothetical protein
MANSKYAMACNGTASAALATGGSNSAQNATEEFSVAGATKTFTTS